MPRTDRTSATNYLPLLLWKQKHYRNRRISLYKSFNRFKKPCEVKKKYFQNTQILFLISFIIFNSIKLFCKANSPSPSVAVSGNPVCPCSCLARRTSGKCKCPFGTKKPKNSAKKPASFCCNSAHNNAEMISILSKNGAWKTLRFLFFTSFFKMYC